MKVLMTGATGYAGFYAAIALRKAGHRVRGLVHDESKPRAQKLIKHEVTVAPGDIREPETYRDYLADSDVIIHAMMDFESPKESDGSIRMNLLHRRRLAASWGGYRDISA